MTQAFNLSQLANNLNTSGQLDATDGLTGAVPVANGGTGQTSLTSGALITGNGTSAVGTIAVGTSGQAIISNGSAWVAGTPASSITGSRGQVFTSSGTFTIPTGITSVKATIVGGGGGGGGSLGSCCYNYGGGAGGGGGVAIVFLNGITSGATISVTVGGGGSGSSATGGTGGTSSISSGTQSITTVSATGGGGGSRQQGGYGGTGIGGTATNGSLNMNGGSGLSSNPNLGGSTVFSVGVSLAITNVNGIAGNLYGGGGTGVVYPTNTARSGGSGASGVVFFEW